MLSPLLRVENVETPTILLCGRIDWNVAILNSQLFHQALKVRGIPSELIAYPEVYHENWPDEFEKDYLKRVVDCFDDNMARG